MEMEMWRAEARELIRSAPMNMPSYQQFYIPLNWRDRWYRNKFSCLMKVVVDCAKNEMDELKLKRRWRSKGEVSVWTMGVQINRNDRDGNRRGMYRRRTPRLSTHVAYGWGIFHIKDMCSLVHESTNSNAVAMIAITNDVRQSPPPRRRVSFSDVPEVKEVCHQYPSDFFYTKCDAMRSVLSLVWYNLFILQLYLLHCVTHHSLYAKGSTEKWRGAHQLH